MMRKMSEKKDLHKNQIKIRDYQGYEIYYAHREFIAYNKGEKKRVVSARTEAELAEKIKAFEKSLKQFKPLNVIKVDVEKEGRLTSRDAQYPDDHVIFSYKTSDSSSRGGKATYGHTGVLVQRYDGTYAFVEATPKNLEILKKIKYQGKKITALKDDIEKLKKGFEKPITFERLEEQET